ncbi:MAG: cobalamin-dependent protein [Peptococcaceae bacterium]|jgi:methylmalonyl-CoA mutase cobalamin-binding domain/chain|nr:cobalamin-dependent protein [Peptococcaceae bacterium]
MADMNLLKRAMGDLEEDAVLRIVKEVAGSGGGEAGAAMEACQDGMKMVGDRFEAGEYFIGDLIFAGEIMINALEIIKPFLSAGDSGGKGKMILCTVQGDLHDIGKNIVKSMLEAAGFDVLDLGIDVSPETVLETAKAEGVRIIALSGVLTLALDAMKDVVDIFKSAGLRDSVKIIIGGNPVTKEACAKLGADEWAHSPQKTVNVCSAWAAGA